MQTISSIFCSLFKCSSCRDPPIIPTDSTTQSPNLELQFEDQAKFRLNIIGITGKTIQQNVFQLMKLKDVKNYAVEKMFDGSNRSDHFKLIRCKTCEIFDEDNDDDTIKKIGIDDEG